MGQVLDAGDFFTRYSDKYLLMQAPAPIAIYKGRELHCVFMNDAYTKIFNNKPLLEPPFLNTFPEVGYQPFINNLEKIFDTGIPFHADEIQAEVDVNSDGKLRPRYYSFIYTPLKDKNEIIEAIMAFGYDVTDQVELRKKEKQNDLTFRSIIEQSPDPIFILKSEKLILDAANKALFKLWNVGKDVVGKPLLEILPEMKEQGFHKLLLDVFYNSTPHYGYETPAYFIESNGNRVTHYFNFSYQPYKEVDGTTSGVLVLATDVTEQVISKQRLIQSEVNFQNMILQAPVAICVLKGMNYIVEIANDLMYELWGKKKEEVHGKPVFEGIPEGKNQGLEILLNDVYKTGKRFNANEHPVQLPRNGKIETRYLNFVYEAFTDGDGIISGIIAVATDVTEQVEARQKIEDAEENARLAIELADLGTYEINISTQEMFTSDRFNTMWGIDHPENKRSQFGAVIHPDDLLIRAQAYEEAMKTGKLHFEVRVIWKDGSHHWMRVKGKVLFDKNGKPERLLGMGQDITDQKIFAEELTRKVEERSKALRQANERLKQSNEELEQFAYVASHDLQEPLRKIHVFSSMIKDQSELKGQSILLIEKVTESASRMTGLIKSLLEYSLLSKKDTHFEKTNLNEVIKFVLADFELLIDQKAATINISELPHIEAIPLQMNQLFFNLIGNALKFSRKNVPPVININSKKLDSDELKQFPELDTEGEYYNLEIRDNGIGFSQEYADKIFTIFQRLNEKSIFGGYGIGLALSRKIVNKHNGIIYAKGTPKDGATFNIILPEKQIKQ